MPESTQPDANQFEHFHEDEEREEIQRDLLSTEFFVQQIKETAEKLLRDETSRGDVKLLNTALKELRYAFKVFSAYRKRRKVSVFGSARLPLEHPDCIQAIEFGKRMAEAGYMVITGAANGIMEAGHVGAGKDESIGVNIMLPFEQEANSIIANDVKLMHMKYFFTRKLLFVKESDAIALFPGGFGTQDEGFEALTLVQTGKSHLFPIIMCEAKGGDYWTSWEKYIVDVLLKRKMISPEDLALFRVTDSVDEAVQEVCQFYRVYHSMRYVKNDLVLRLTKKPGKSILREINRNFREVLVTGEFEIREALPAEANEPSLAQLPRLCFHFNRKSLGRLRMLINFLNQEVE